MITSNYLWVTSSFFWASKSKSNLVTSAHIGTALSPTCDFESELQNIYFSFFTIILRILICKILFSSQLPPEAILTYFYPQVVYLRWCCHQRCLILNRYRISLAISFCDSLLAFFHPLPHRQRQMILRSNLHLHRVLNPLNGSWSQLFLIRVRSFRQL